MFLSVEQRWAEKEARGGVGVAGGLVKLARRNERSKRSQWCVECDQQLLAASGSGMVAFDPGLSHMAQREPQANFPGKAEVCF